MSLRRLSRMTRRWGRMWSLVFDDEQVETLKSGGQVVREYGGSLSRKEFSDREHIPVSARSTRGRDFDIIVRIVGGEAVQRGSGKKRVHMLYRYTFEAAKSEQKA